MTVLRLKMIAVLVVAWRIAMILLWLEMSFVAGIKRHLLLVFDNLNVCTSSVFRS